MPRDAGLLDVTDHYRLSPTRANPCARTGSNEST